MVHAQPRTRSRLAGGQDQHQRPQTKATETLPVHEGQDWIYVLAGRLRLLLGEEDFVNRSR